jgi:hypothetical protein
LVRVVLHGVVRRADCGPDSQFIAIADPDGVADLHAAADGVTDRVAVGWAERNAYRNADGDTNRDADRDADDEPNSDTVADSDADVNPGADAEPISNAISGPDAEASGLRSLPRRDRDIDVRAERRYGSALRLERLRHHPHLGHERPVLLIQRHHDERDQLRDLFQRRA